MAGEEIEKYVREELAEMEKEKVLEYLENNQKKLENYHEDLGRAMADEFPTSGNKDRLEKFEKWTEEISETFGKEKLAEDWAEMYSKTTEQELEDKKEKLGEGLYDGDSEDKDVEIKVISEGNDKKMDSLYENVSIDTKIDIQKVGARQDMVVEKIADKLQDTEETVTDDMYREAVKEVYPNQSDLIEDFLTELENGNNFISDTVGAIAGIDGKALGEKYQEAAEKLWSDYWNQKIENIYGKG